MPHFDIVKINKPKNTFRVSKIKADFDVDFSHSNEHFIGDINIPEKWNIGLICGDSGTGKSTIAKEIFGDNLVQKFDYSASSVVDDISSTISMNDISKMFYSVGFASVPSWLKPYSVLSTGEKMRVNLARALLERDLIVFDEFTSVVDRTVAITTSLAISKAVRKLNKQFVAISCHMDIIDALSPDWVFNTNTMQNFFGQARIAKCNLKSDDAGEKNGENLAVIII